MEKIILKLGGSAITKNSQDFPLKPSKIYDRARELIREGAIEKAAKTIKRVKDEEDFSIIILNGAGPFGHFLVNNYLKNEEPNPTITHYSVELLNLFVSRSLNHEGIRAVPISPFNTCIFTRRGHLVRDLFSKSRNLLKKGETPISYGDLVRARGREGRLGGYEVISGDDIALRLSSLWQPDRILMATDVKGVYDKNPKENEDAEFMDNIAIKKKSDLGISTDMNRVDVTGGMKSKVGKLLASGVESYIFKLTEDNLEKALKGRHVGTKIQGISKKEK